MAIRNICVTIDHWARNVISPEGINKLIFVSVICSDDDYDYHDCYDDDSYDYDY